MGLSLTSPSGYCGLQVDCQPARWCKVGKVSQALSTEEVLETRGREKQREGSRHWNATCDSWDRVLNHSTGKDFPSPSFNVCTSWLENQVTSNPTVNIRCPEVFPFGCGWCSELTVSVVCEPIKPDWRRGQAAMGSGAAPHARKTFFFAKRLSPPF